MTECEHIYGFENGGGYEPSYLIDDPKVLDDDFDIPFKYCPLCGIELKEGEK